jgi:hypothetical protein
MVQDVIFYIPHFAKALLRNVPYRYVVLEKRSADMKFRNEKKFWLWYISIFWPISSTGSNTV